MAAGTAAMATSLDGFHATGSARRYDELVRAFFAAVEDPLSFVAVEEWADREALDRHFAEPHLLEFSRRLLNLVSAQPEVAIHEIADTKPFPRGGDEPS